MLEIFSSQGLEYSYLEYYSKSKQHGIRSLLQVCCYRMQLHCYYGNASEHIYKYNTNKHFDLTQMERMLETTERKMEKSYFYCGSIVAGGLLDTAYVTQVTPSTSFVILLLIFSINS